MLFTSLSNTTQEIFVFGGGKASIS